MSLVNLNFVNIVVNMKLTLHVKRCVNIDVMTVAWCFAETIQFSAASALVFQLAALNRLVSVLAGLTSQIWTGRF